MNYIYKIMLALLSIGSINHLAFGYEYTFSNHIPEKPLETRIKLLGVQEPWYTKIIAPDTTETFLWETRTKKDPLGYGEWRKAGLCLQSIQYRLPGSAAWREADVIFVDSNAYKRIVAAAEGLGEGTAGVAQFAAAVSGIPTQKVSGGSLARGITELIGTSTCRDRHFDILPDKDNPQQIAFYSLTK